MKRTTTKAAMRVHCLAAAEQLLSCLDGTSKPTHEVRDIAQSIEAMLASVKLLDELTFESISVTIPEQPKGDR